MRSTYELKRHTHKEGGLSAGEQIAASEIHTLGAAQRRKKYRFHKKTRFLHEKRSFFCSVRKCSAFCTKKIGLSRKIARFLQEPGQFLQENIQLSPGETLLRYCTISVCMRNDW